MENDFLQSTDEMATNVVSNHGQIRKAPKRSPNPLGYEGRINLGQGRENSRVAWLDYAFDTIERPPVAAYVLDDRLRDFSCIEQGKLFSRTHL